MKYILASFCNVSCPTASPLLLISLPLNSSSRMVPVSLGGGIVGTSTGLARGDGKVFVAFLSEGKFRLSILDEKTLFPLFTYNFPGSQDVHSMLYDQGHLYTVSTGTDEIVRYGVSKKGLGNPEVIWSASPDKKENHHINSIFKFGSDILISAFGKSKVDNVWRTSYDGIIFNVTKGVILRDGLYQPHSVSSNGKEVFYCESGYGKFSSLSKPIKTLDGYTRGMQFESSNNVYVSTSIGRSKKKANTFYNPADYGKKKGRCGIYSINLNTKKINSFIDVGWFADEIYDLILLDNVENVDSLLLSSFLQERKILSETISETSKFWNFVKGKVK